MVTKTTFKKKFPDVKVQKLQTEVVFSRKHVEDTILQMCGMMGLGLLYYSYSNKWITVYTSEKMKKALDSILRRASPKTVKKILFLIARNV